MIAIYSTNTTAISQNNYHKGERGITLIMVLIFIVTLSLVAAVGMRGVITGDRMVANERDKALAFQAAESAGREAVAAITAVPPTHTLNAATPLPFGGNAEFWRTTSSVSQATDCSVQAVSTPEANRKRFNWTLNGVGCATDSSANYGNADKPRYFIELMPSVPGASTTDCWYRITSRATGGSKEADVILQLMFSKTVPGAAAVCS